MKKLLLYLQNHQTSLAVGVLFALSMAAVVYLNPREVSFKYEFQKGKPWLYEDLVAPFDVPLFKTDEQLEAERERLRETKTLFLQRDTQVAEKALIDFEERFNQRWREARKQAEADSLAGRAREVVRFVSEEERQQWLDIGLQLLGSVYRQGILQDMELSELEYGDVIITESGISSSIELEELYSLQEARDFLEQQLRERGDGEAASFMLPILTRHLKSNVRYNQELTQKNLAAQIENILPTRGILQEGELIIVKGHIVDEENYMKLRSLRKAYEGNFQNRFNILYILLGQTLQALLLFSILYVFLMQFRPLLMQDTSKVTFLLVNILIIVGLTRLVMDLGMDYIWLIPFPILPITMRSFFDTRLALFVHMIAIVLCGFMVPNSFVFIYLQFVAGVFSVVMVNNLYKRSQLFFTAGKITLVYCLAYFSVAIVQEGRLEGIEYLHFAFFAGNGFLTLMSFPLIYFQEKIFGLVSDVSLLELSDTNNPLLRELSQKAPGTFQHSLQVANLAEAAILAIKGNALLVRTGALYHDIGKMANPLYFIENQSTGLNPHDELSFEESADIIINHVRYGIKLAKKHNLPDVLIDFIRTHHGTTTVMYFYRQYIKNFPEEEVDLAKFTYPGPQPFSKETAALMMADSVEAASRSLTRPDHAKLDQLVEDIINGQLKSGQFENANITMKDIKAIKKIFKKMLMNIYHVRIQYPD